MVAADRLLGAAGAVADAGAVRDPAEAGPGRPRRTPSAACSAGSTASSTASATAMSRTVGWSLKRTGRLMVHLRRAAGRPGLGASCGCPAASCRSTTRASSPPTCRRRPTPRTTAPRPRSRRWSTIWRNRPGVDNVTFLTGYSFLGQGVNTAQAFITLKDWSERGPNESAAAIVDDINREMASIRDAKISALQPPPIDNLGNSAGFSFRLQDRGQKGYPALMAATDQLITAANASPVLHNVYVEGLPRGAAGQPGDRPREGERLRRHLRGHQQHHLDQPRLGLRQRLPQPRAHAARDRAERCGGPHERRRHPGLQRQEQPQGQLVPFSAFATVEWAKGPTQIVGFNYYPSVRISGEAQARLHQRRRHRRDGAAGRPVAARLRLRMDRPVAAGEARRARRRRSCWRCRRWWSSSAWPRSTRAGRSRSPCC